jgi:hypothetical protein
MFDKRSHYLLNHFTLQVKDHEIARAVENQNAANNANIMKPVVYITASYALLHLFEFIVWGLAPIKLYSSFTHVFYALLILLVMQKSPSGATRVIWLYLLHWCIQVNLTYRDAVPEVFLESDKASDDNSILTSLVVCHMLNQNSFLVTIFLQPTIVLFSYHYQLVIQARLFRDPYDHTTGGFTPEE